MRYEVKSELRGTPQNWSWEDGKLDGDPVAVFAIESAANAWEGQWIGFAGGESTLTDHLSSPLSTLALAMQKVGMHILAISGDLPEQRPVPNGAVA